MRADNNRSHPLSAHAPIGWFTWFFKIFCFVVVFYLFFIFYPNSVTGYNVIRLNPIGVMCFTFTPSTMSRCTRCTVIHQSSTYKETHYSTLRNLVFVVTQKMHAIVMRKDQRWPTVPHHSWERLNELAWRRIRSNKRPGKRIHHTNWFQAFLGFAATRQHSKVKLQYHQEDFT